MTAQKVSGLHKKFGDIVALDGLDLEVNSGEFFALLGPSASGKTTTLRSICGSTASTAATAASMTNGGTSRAIRRPRIISQVRQVAKGIASLLGKGESHSRALGHGFDSTFENDGDVHIAFEGCSC